MEQRQLTLNNKGKFKLENRHVQGGVIVHHRSTKVMNVPAIRQGVFSTLAEQKVLAKEQKEQMQKNQQIKGLLRNAMREKHD